MVRARVLPLQRRQCRKPERASMRCCALARSRTSTVFHINRNSRKKCETYFASIGFYMRGISDTIKSLCPPSRHKTIETQVFSQHFPAILFIIQYGECKIKVKISNCEGTKLLILGVNNNGTKQLQ